MGRFSVFKIAGFGLSNLLGSPSIDGASLLPGHDGSGAEVDKAEASQESHDLECEVLTALDYDLAQMRGRSKPSVLKRGVERFMLSFIGNAGPIAAAMHARSNC